MVNEKNILIENIKVWVELDNNISELQKKLKELKTEKQNISNTLIKIMDNNEIDEFTINNGKLIHRKSKVKSAINKSYLLEKLNEYFQNHPEIDTNDIGSYILDNRPIKENSSLIIKKNN